MEARTPPGGPAPITANDRARDLFLSLISPEQRAQFERGQHVMVRARQTGRRYIVECHGGRHGNIIELGQNDEHLARLCVAPGGNIPHFDAILGQIVALEHDEQHVRDTANFTPLVTGYRKSGVKVELAAPPLGVHRTEYSLRWHDWAMPLRIVFAQSWIPGPSATFELDDRWLKRRYLVVHVLCVRAEVVITGPLWPEEEEEE